MIKLLNNLKLREKNLIIIFVSIFIPMLLTNIYFFRNIEDENRSQTRAEMKNAASRLEYDIRNSLRELISIADYIERMDTIDDFLEKEYKSEADYYAAFNELMESEAIQYYYSAESTDGITICTDNPTIVNGRYFVNRELVTETFWYKKLMESERDYIVCAFYENGESGGYIPIGRHLAIVKKMNFYDGNGCIMLDVNYDELQKSMTMICGGHEGYLMDENGNVIMSAGENDNASKAFGKLDLKNVSGVLLEREPEIYGTKFKILMIDNKKSWVEIPGEKINMLIALYIFSLILPAITLYLIFRSINDRLYAMGENIERVKNDLYEEVKIEPSRDEIGSIIQSYNLMVLRIRELIETVYKNKEREQELLLSKKQAELHALQSQINPHFMFNALESIRMHSLIKNETETAKILENFSMLLRENIRWNSDKVTVENECRNVQRYLEIQKYRFGDRLEFSLTVQEECRELFIPKFSIITFVENACIHGIENSVEGGSISVVVSLDEGLIYAEIMDNGRGMDEERLAELRELIENADISYIEAANKSIGIINTVIRLKQLYGEKLIIEINSSEAGGTEVCIVMPGVDNEGNDN